MNRLLASADTLTDFAGTHRVQTARIDALAGGHTGALAGLGPTFGLIGFDFLAALAEVCDARERGLHALAAEHSRVATATTAAGSGYRESDEAGADLMNGEPR